MLLSACVALLLVVVSSNGAFGQRVPEIPRAPRDDSGRFLNFRDASPDAGLGVRLPFFWRRALGSFRTRRGAARLASQSSDQLRQLKEGSDDFAYWIGHATVLARLDGRTFLTDPVWSKAAGPGGRIGAKRLAPPAVSIDDLPPIHVVLISHNHYDHLDLPTLRKLAKRNPALVLITPLGHRKVLDSVDVKELIQLDWGDTVLRHGLEIICLPVQHWSQRGLFDARRGLWSSWAIRSATKRFYFGGDSGFFPEFELIGKTVGPFDLAALPIGAYEPSAMMKTFHMNPEETTRAASLLESRRVLAIHYGTFDLTDEPLDEPPARFREAMERSGRDPDEVWIFDIGEGREF